ncbi:MAG: RNHCP domain-containing protein [Clostridia bacterium]|nr:RNHCP domain-containing protein [Clostridia bacterium]
MTFRKKDSGFVCGHCGENVEPLGYTSRNHCPKCLYSLHVDIDPGDRANECKGLMAPTQIEYNSNKGYVILHKCTRCGELKRNKCAEDDNYELILAIMKNMRI